MACHAQEAERDAVEIEEEPRVAEYLALARQATAQRAALRSATFAPKHALPFLQPGRLVRLLAPPPAAGAAPAAVGNAGDISAAEGLLEEPTVWGAIVNFERVGGKSKGACCTLAMSDGLLWIKWSSSHVHGLIPRLMLLVCCASPSLLMAHADGEKKKNAASYIVDVLVHCAEGSAPTHGSRQQPRLVSPSPADGVPLVVTFPLEQVHHA